MEFSYIFVLGILFILLIMFPFIVEKILKQISMTSQKMELSYIIYFSVLIFVILLCCIPVMLIMRVSNLMFINLIALPCIPWLIYKRYQMILQNKRDSYYFIYIFLFEIILLFMFVTCICLFSTNISYCI